MRACVRPVGWLWQLFTGLVTSVHILTFHCSFEHLLLGVGHRWAQHALGGQRTACWFSPPTMRGPGTEVVRTDGKCLLISPGVYIMYSLFLPIDFHGCCKARLNW